MKKEQWFVVDGYPGANPDAVPAEGELGDTGVWDPEDDKKPILEQKDAQPKLMDHGAWESFGGSSGNTISWKELSIARPDEHTFVVANRSSLWRLDVTEETEPGTLLNTASIDPGETFTYQLPVLRELHGTPGFAVMFHFDRPDDTESLVYVWKK